MFSSKAYRTAGLVALCLVIGAFSGALGGAQQPLPQFQILPPPNGIPSPGGPLGWPRSLDDGYLLAEVKECGTAIAQIISFGVFCVRKANGVEAIGGIRVQENLLSSSGVGPFPKGDYYIFLGHVEGFPGIPLPPELGTSWFMVMVNSQGENVAVFVPSEPILAEEVNGDEMLLALIPPFNGIPTTAGPGCCDLTVQILSVTARKFSSPCTAPPCPAWWDIMASATIKNIGQKDVKAPFTVRVLLNGRLIHEEEIAGLAAGASQPISAMETVTQPGLYLVTVIVDPEDRINGEGDETNNIAERSIYVQ
ncbi:MAG: CARDB domain-containing protein [Candidatus Bipolaricaulia bacterium]